MKSHFRKKFLILPGLFLIFISQEVYAQQTPLGQLFASILSIVRSIVCSRIVALINSIVLPLALVFFTIAAIRFLIAAGDPGKIKQEKERIMIVITALFIIYAVSVLVIKAINTLAPGWFEGCGLG